MTTDNLIYGTLLWLLAFGPMLALGVFGAWQERRR